jgi:hypothetical protein
VLESNIHQPTGKERPVDDTYKYNGNFFVNYLITISFKMFHDFVTLLQKKC